MAAAFDIWISNANMGKIIGKLSMGIRVALRPALAAIADMRVKHIEKLRHQKTRGVCELGCLLTAKKPQHQWLPTIIAKKCCISS